MDLVSICIPCHNAAPYVGAALDSALAQTWEELEIIVVNDGSTDGSREILSEYEGFGVRVIHENCGNAAKARNIAYAEAKGAYIKFFDADDILSPDMIRLQMLRLSERNDAVASSEWGRFHSDDISSFKPELQTVWRDMAATDWLVEAWADARPMMQPGMFLIPRSILEASGVWDEELTLIDDFEFFARVLCSTDEVLFSSGATLLYRSGISGSLSGQKSRRAAESAFLSLTRGTAHLLARRNDEMARRSCANALQDFVYSFYPEYDDLCVIVERQIKQIGGSDLIPDGPPNFHRLRQLIGWRLARRIQKFVKS